MMTTTHKAMIATLSTLVLALGVARAEPASDALRGRVEDELLSDGISLARLGQRLELRTTGTSLEVVLSDAGSGKVLATRVIDRLPAAQSAAVAQLTVVVSDMLRERGLVPSTASPAASWAATFAPAAVVAYHRPGSIAVIAVARSGRAGDDTRAAAAALVAAYRAAGIATVKDGGALGEVSEADDAAIVTRAAPLSVERIAIVRAFAEGPSVRAIVTIYGANHQLVTGFSAVAGQALAAPAPAPSNDGSVADQIMRTKRSEPALDKDGVVRLWVQPNDPKIQLLRTEIAHVVASSGGTGTVGFSNIVCRAPCGVVVDGSLGETYTFGDQQTPLTDRFQLLGHKGDITARVKLGKPGMRIGAWMMLTLGGSGLAVGLGSALSPSSVRSDTVTTAGFVAGGVGLLAGYLLWTASSPDVVLTQGQPK
jgi:hypothetical protein